MEIGASPFDDEMAELVPQIHQKAMAGDVKLYFPIDFVVADPLDKDAPPAAADEDTGIPEGKTFSKIIKWWIVLINLD